MFIGILFSLQVRADVVWIRTDCRRKYEELEEARGRAEQAIQEVRVGKQEIQR